MKYKGNEYALMRHGEATHNIDGLLASGTEDEAHTSYLTEKGKEQAQEGARRLVEIGKWTIFSSPYKRTLETASIVGKTIGVEPTVDARLSEIDGGVFNWKPIVEYSNFLNLADDPVSARPEGGESFADLGVRIRDFLEEICEKFSGERILVVTHGGPLRVAEAIFKGKDGDPFSVPAYREGEVRV